MADKEMCQLPPFVKIIFFTERLMESCRDGCGARACVQELTHAHKNESKQMINEHVEYTGRGGMPHHQL